MSQFLDGLTSGALLGMVIGLAIGAYGINDAWTTSACKAGLAHYAPTTGSIIYDAWKPPAPEKKECIYNGCQD